ncbi:MAG: caspase family protein [Saprospiraceae bacterium]
MKIIVLFLLLLTGLLSAQTEKGATPLPSQNSTPKTQNSTRAVVVGISDYQSPAIHDLQFAHSDAEAFAAWLKSPAGGSVPAENVQLLINAKATGGALLGALEWLMDETKPDDQVIFYFSGHGDVETRTLRQNGFLLVHESPANNYVMGAFSVGYLKDVVETLVQKNKARVLVITDACHAGKLAGANTGGAQATALALREQFAGEIKIMSCQPDEFSLESTQWGDGRGAFSFHLVEGLTGLADASGDGMVTLRELDRYLGDWVPAETAPNIQVPFVSGDLKSVLARVDAGTLDSLRKHKLSMSPNLMAAKSKGMEDALLANADSVSAALYESFKLAIERGHLIEPADSSAYALYQYALNRSDLLPIRNLMRRNLAAALYDEVQQALNALLEGDPNEVNIWRTNPARYADYPRYLERALELLGEGHYMRNTLLSKKRYFESYLHLRNVADMETNPVQRETERDRARGLLREAIGLEPQAAYLYHALALSFFNANPTRTDSVDVYCQKAMEQAPQWLLPYLDLFYEYNVSTNNYRTGEKWLLLAAERHPESYIVLERLAWLRQWQNRTDETLDICRKMIAIKPALYSGYGTMGVTYWMRGEYPKAVEWLKKAQQLTHELWTNEYLIASCFKMRDFQQGYTTSRGLLMSEQTDVNNKAGIVARLLNGLYDYHRYDLAQSYLGLADSLRGYPFYHVIANLNEAKTLFAFGRTAEAEQRFRGVFALDNAGNAYFSLADAWLGNIAAAAGNTVEAEAYFQKAMVSRGANALDQVEPMEESCALYGHFLLSQNRLPEAEQRFRQALEWRRQNSAKGWYGLACLYAKKGDTTAALDCLEKALDNWYPIPGPILEEPLFKKIRKTKRFAALLAKHFPEGKK